MCRTLAVHMHYESWYISWSSSARHQREMTKFSVSWWMWTTIDRFPYVNLKLLSPRFLPHFDVICDLLLNRRTATFVKWNFRRLKKCLLYTDNRRSFRVSQTSRVFLWLDRNANKMLPTSVSKNCEKIKGKSLVYFDNQDVNYLWLSSLIIKSIARVLLLCFYWVFEAWLLAGAFLLGVT